MSDIQVAINNMQAVVDMSDDELACELCSNVIQIIKHFQSELEAAERQVMHYSMMNTWPFQADALQSELEAEKAKMVKVAAIVKDWSCYAGSADFEERNNDLMKCLVRIQQALDGAGE